MRLLADSWAVAKTVGEITVETIETLVSILIRPHRADAYCAAVDLPPIRLKDGDEEKEWSDTVAEVRNFFEAADDPTKYAAATSSAVTFINAIGSKLVSSDSGPGQPVTETIIFKLIAPILVHVTQRRSKMLYTALVALLMIDQRMQDSLPGGTFTDRTVKLLGALAAKAGWTRETSDGDTEAAWASATAELIAIAAVLLRQFAMKGSWSAFYGLDLKDDDSSTPLHDAHDLLRRAVTLTFPNASLPYDYAASLTTPDAKRIEQEKPDPLPPFAITAIPVPKTNTDPEQLFVRFAAEGDYATVLDGGWHLTYTSGGAFSLLASYKDYQFYGDVLMRAELFQEGDLNDAAKPPAATSVESDTARASVEAKRIGVGVQADNDGLAAWAEVKQCKVTVSGGHWLAEYIPELSFTLDEAIDWRIGQRPHFRGGVGGDVILNLGKKVPIGLGTLAVNSVRLKLALSEANGNSAVQIAATTDLTLSIFGLLDISAVGLGLALSVGSKQDMKGNLAGVAHTDGLQVLTPTAAGLGVHRYGLEGDGILQWDEATGTLFGGLELGYKSKFKFTGLGLYQTSDGARPSNWLLALTMTTAASPGGFVPKGGGLLYASERRTDPQAFLAAVQTGELAVILAPVDPVTHAAAYRQSLDRLFPTQHGSQVFGALVKFEGFGGKLHFDIGALLEWGNGDLVHFYLIAAFSFIPVRKDADIKDRPIVVLADGVLVSDLSTGELNVRIALRNSRLWSAELTGEAMVFYGAPDQASHCRAFFLSVGGFHPSYVPGPNLFVPKRLTLTLRKGDHLRMEMSAYLAVTPQSFQIGFRSAIEAHLYGFGIRGSLDLDALVHFDFRIVIDIKISVELLLGSRTLAAVTFQGSLSVFVPTILAGSVKVKFLFWTLSKSGSLTIVDGAAERENVDVPRLIEAAIQDRANWDFGGTSGFAPTPVARDGGWYDGFTAPVFRQSVVPFNTPIDRLAGAAFDTPQTFIVDAVTVGATSLANVPILEDFAIGQYLDLSDDEMLGGAMFERWTAGFALDLPFEEAEAASVSLDPEELIRDPEKPPEPRSLLDFAEIADRLSRFAAVIEPPRPIRLTQPRYRLLDDHLQLKQDGLNLAQARATRRGSDRIAIELAA